MRVILRGRCKGYPNKNTVTTFCFLTLCWEHRKNTRWGQDLYVARWNAIVVVLMLGWNRLGGEPNFAKLREFIGFLRGGCPRGVGNWGTLTIPREDWGSLGESPPPLKNQFHPKWWWKRIRGKCPQCPKKTSSENVVFGTWILCVKRRWWTTPEGHHLRIWRLMPRGSGLDRKIFASRIVGFGRVKDKV